MSHVAEEIGAVLVSNFAKTFIVQTPAVAGDSGDDDFRFEQFRIFRESIVVDPAARRINFIRHRFKEDGCSRYLLVRREETYSAQTRLITEQCSTCMHVQVFLFAFTVSEMATIG